VSTVEPSDQPAGDEVAAGNTPVALTYNDASSVTTTEAATQVALAGNTHRPPVRLAGRVKDPLKLREALSALYAVVSSDYRYVPKDRTAYAAYLRLKRETSALSVWQAQQAYFSWLSRNDPLAAMILDPVITAHPDRVLLEVFSKDESTYAQLGIDLGEVALDGPPNFGTTNVDFSQALFDGVQLMRSYRETRLAVGEGGVHVATAGTKTVIEKKINVPDTWLRGFLQVQSASTLAMDRFELTPLDLYNVLRTLRMHADRKGKRRGLRVELIPAEAPRLVLEPWETVIPCSAGPYQGKAARVARVWGRRRLLLLRRLLPYLQRCEVFLLGSGLPSFWVLRAEGVTLTLGMTGFTAANWSQAVNFDLLLPRKTGATGAVGKVVEHLRGGTWFATAADIGKATGLKGPALVEALQAGCQQGQLMYDLAHGVFRLRPLVETPLDLERLRYRNQREKVAHDLLVRRGAVKIVSENRIPGTGLELTGKVAVAEDRREYRPQMLLADEGQVTRAECTCSLFRKQGLKAGPCVHLIALRLAYAEQEAQRAKGVDPRQVITAETRTYSKRDESGEERVYQVTLDRQRLKVRWGRPNQPQRQQTLRYNSVDEARAAYFNRIAELDERGYLSTTGD
jgi:hypothetical protein